MSSISYEAVANIVDGIAVESADEAVMDIVNPSTGKAIAVMPQGCESDVERAVASSRRALEDGRWSEQPASFRKKVLYRFAELIEGDAERLDAQDAIEMGKPISLGFGNARGAGSLMRFYGEALDKITGDVYISDRGSYVSQRRTPRGVVAAVIPWNFPTYACVMKVAPALAAGNCVVLKPSEISPSSAMRLANLALKAGVPPGVLNIVQGLGSVVGKSLGTHAGIDMLTFTGSTSVGKRMLQYAGQSNLKVVMAECGGKSPHIVFADVTDAEAVSDSIARTLITNQGQVCSIGTRLLVHRSIEEKVLARIRDRLNDVTMGDALDRRTTFGPVATSQQCTRILEYIESANAEGAQLVAGGARVMKETGGYFVQPTVFRAVSPNSRIAQDEIFGPVLAVLGFDTEAEAVRIANDTIFGLTAFVWTTDLSRGMRVAKAMRSSVWINSCVPTGERAGYMASFEPAGQSGIGTEGGLAGLESYQRRQLIGINHT